MSIVTLTALALLAQAPIDGPRVGVSDVTATKDLAPLAGAVTGSVANELQRLGSFPVTTTEQLRNLLSLERQQQLLGCSDDTCKGGVVSQLGFDYLVSGRLTKLSGKKDQTFTLELTLLDVKSGKREQSTIITAGTESDLFGKVSGGAVKLVQPILRGRLGSLVVIAGETGASVKIDDVMLGVTPLGRLALASGPHLLQVEKEGFVTYKKEVRVQPDQVTEESIRMVPSPDYIQAYEAKNTRLQMGGFITGGLAVVGLAVGVAFQAKALADYGSELKTGTFVYYRGKLADGIESEGEIDYRSQANKLKADIQTSQTLSWVGLGVGAASAVASVVLFMLSDKPNKYAPYKQVKTAAHVGLLIVPNGARGTLTLAW